MSFTRSEAMFHILEENPGDIENLNHQLRNHGYDILSDQEETNFQVMKELDVNNIQAVRRELMEMPLHKVKAWAKEHSDKENYWAVNFAELLFAELSIDCRRLR